MSFFREKQSRYFFCMVLLFILLLFGVTFFFCFKQAQVSRDLLVTHDKVIAASLLEQGVSSDVVVSALTNTEKNEQGNNLLQQTGITEQTAFIFFPLITELQSNMVTLIMPCILALAILALAGSFAFLAKREKLYQEAMDIVKNFAEGDFSSHLPRAEGGTLYQLFSSIDHLATALQAKNESEQKARIFLKDTISDISHQLKTPLAALNMYHEIISEEPDNPDTVSKFSQKTVLALERMEQLIQSLLKITRLDAGSITFEKECCLMEEIIKQATEELFTRAEQEKKVLIISGDPQELLFCDMQWTSEAITNLVKNALDHTSSSGHIWISWERTPAMLRLSVQDDGTGIAPEDIHHIFKRFYRSKNSLDTQGIGLGLPLSKAIIEGQGGVLSVQSTLGLGTTFTISFLTES